MQACAQGEALPPTTRKKKFNPHPKKLNLKIQEQYHGFYYKKAYFHSFLELDTPPPPKCLKPTEKTPLLRIPGHAPVM